MKQIQDWLKLGDYELQAELMRIPYIQKNHPNVLETYGQIPTPILELVLNRLLLQDFSLNIVSDCGDGYELVLLGLGKWRLPDKNGNKLLYRAIAQGKYQTLYECMARAVLVLYKFIMMHKRE